MNFQKFQGSDFDHGFHGWHGLKNNFLSVSSVKSVVEMPFSLVEGFQNEFKVRQQVCR
jgi:hypothetical protein